MSHYCKYRKKSKEKETDKKVVLQKYPTIRARVPSLLKEMILRRAKEINKIENKYNHHLKEGFFVEKRRLLFIHRNVCELLQCFEYNTIAEDHTRIFNK